MPRTKYTKAMVRRITDLIAKDTYSITEICTMVGIDRHLFSRWKERHPEFAEAVEEAENRRTESLVTEARKSLMKKITGYDVIETKTVTAPDPKGKLDPSTGKPKAKVVKQTTVKKHLEPDTTAIIFLLTNADPEHFKNRHSNEVTGKDGRDLFADRTDEELKEELRGLMRVIDGAEAKE